MNGASSMEREALMAAKSTSRENRRKTAPRLTGTYSATLHSAETGAQAIVIRNLTPKGMGAQTRAKTPALGARVVVTLDSLGEMKAKIGRASCRERV